MALKTIYLNDEISADLRNWGNQFLQRFNQEDFGFDRVFDDGTCIRITSNLPIIKDISQNEGLISPYVPESDRSKSRFSLLCIDDVSNYRPDYLEFKGKHSIEHLANFYERKKGFYDRVWFVTRVPLLRTINYYLNDAEHFYTFMQELIKRSIRIFSVDKKERMRLTPKMLSNVRGLDISVPNLMESYGPKVVVTQFSVKFSP